MKRFVVLTVLLFVACREGDGPIGPNGNARVLVISDPPGARLILDNRDTGLRTPDTLRGLGGRHDITAQLDTFNATYGFTARVQLANADSLFTIEGPLVNRCSDIICYNSQTRHYSVNRVRFASNPVGVFFHRGTTGGNGMFWPGTTSNSYAAGSMIGFAGVLGNDTVAIGIYDQAWLAGRPAPTLEQTAERIDLYQTTWIVPPPNSVLRPTVRGIEIAQHISATAVDDDIVFVRLVFRNITNLPIYAALDNSVPPAGRTYDPAYIGFLLDPDIGVAGDDALSYDRDLDMAFAFDARFDENDFQAGFNRGPGLVGLKMIDAPAGTTVILNGWTSTGGVSTDWFAGQISERIGWHMLSGGPGVWEPDHADPRIGHLPLGPGDVRISVSAGPIRLAPGDSAAVTIAIILAEPVAGTFTSGTPVEPGDPTDRTRVLYSVAANLVQKAAVADALARARFAATSPTSRR